MALLSLPNEILLKIARYMLHCTHCDCQHISPEFSAFSRSNRRLHVLLAGSHLGPSSITQMLVWGIANGRNDLVARALEHGANPNSDLYRPLDTWNASGYGEHPIQFAMRMRCQSEDAQSHALKLGALALMFGAGGTCVMNDVWMIGSRGDLDLLTVCLPHVDYSDRLDTYLGPRYLLSVAARSGHVEVAKMALAAGATLNSTGDLGTESFYPALWVCSDASIEVVQVLLDAGGDAAWRAPSGVSVVQNMRQRHWQCEASELEDKIALLVRYGAVDEPSADVTLEPENSARFRPVYRGDFPPGQKRKPSWEYRGWVPNPSARVYHWPTNLLLAQREGGCGCLSCSPKLPIW